MTGGPTGGALPAPKPGIDPVRLSACNDSLGVRVEAGLLVGIEVEFMLRSAGPLNTTASLSLTWVGVEAPLATDNI